MEENLMTNLIIFRNILKDDLIVSYNNLYKKYFKYNKIDSKEEYLNDYYSLCSLLISRGYDSINDYIADKILVDENIFSLNCEKGYIISEKIKKAVFHDLCIIKKIFELPVKSIATSAGDINNFINFSKNEKLIEVFKNSSIEEIYEYMYEEYRNFGSGQYRNNYAFSINESGEIIPVHNFKPIIMEDIYGYNRQKSKIIENTEKFISGKFALNTLLVGDSGTGKSTTVKALIPMFKNKKLRLIELGKENIHHISNIIETLKGRGMYYIIFIDDLSFESNENSYKYLKSAVEGSIYEQPINILFYVTSNRKHLIKESMLDRQHEVHMKDAINEQTSLADRFGLTILYSEPNQNEYYEIVLGLAKKYGLKYDDEEQFLIEAKKFALKNGGRTGRSAVQFVRTL